METMTVKVAGYIILSKGFLDNPAIRTRLEDAGHFVDETALEAMYQEAVLVIALDTLKKARLIKSKAAKAVVVKAEKGARRG